MIDGSERWDFPQFIKTSVSAHFQLHSLPGLQMKNLAAEVSYEAGLPRTPPYIVAPKPAA
jgi:hypothetical protein